MLEYERLKENDSFSTIKRYSISDDAITIFAHNVRSLSKRIDDIVNDDRIMNNGIIVLTKAQINLSGSTWKIDETLKFNLRI